MKFTKSIAALFAAVMLVGGLAFAAEGKKDAAAVKVAGCCAKAHTADKECGHACCVAAAKEGNNCTKCGGSGKIEKKTEAKK